MTETANPQLPLFADVVLPLAVPQTYSYGVPALLWPHIKVGQRVVVQLGKRKLYTGIVIDLHQNKLEYAVKPIEEIIDDTPIVYPKQIEFWQWLSSYYMCTLGEVMNAAIPAGLKLQSQSRILLNKNFAEDWQKLSDSEFLILEALDVRGTITIDEAAKILAVKNPMRVLNFLLNKNAILLEEEVKAGAKAKMHNAISLFSNFSEAEINAQFSELKKAKKQLDVYLAFFALQPNYKAGKVPEKKLLQAANASKSSLDGLLKKELLLREIDLIKPEEIQALKTLALSESQQKSLAQINAAFAQKKPVLLHGVTSSGKTEIYISLIKNALKTHQRALYLVPEISLTTQLINRLQLHFGEDAVVYHSRISQGERLAAYARMIDEEKPLVVVAARSGLLLPFHDLGIIIIDEEHDSSFKQHDPAPRYQARDAALFLAHKNNCPILLGSATPSAESYHNSLENRYQLVELKERFGGVQMPEINVINLRKETLWKQMHGHFSRQLLSEIEDALAEQKRAILFQNRRGYTPVVQCTHCGHTQECANCDITLTYHKFSNQLKCHYCGFTTPPPSACPKCGNTHLKEVGFGTEKLEEELQMLLPEAKIARMDFDSTRKKNAFNQLISDFEEGNIDVLVGTQMVTKGLDFDDVQLVGILNADSMLHFPDFRAQERAFQMMAQVAGRAGRRNERGMVSIQSYNPEHEIIKHVVAHDYKTMILQQLGERKIFKYPPFSRLIHIDLKHRDIKTLDAAAYHFAEGLRKPFGDMVLGPEYPPTKRKKSFYHKSILLKLPKDISVQKTKEFLQKMAFYILSSKTFSTVRCTFDVDPY